MPQIVTRMDAAYAVAQRTFAAVDATVVVVGIVTNYYYSLQQQQQQRLFQSFLAAVTSAVAVAAAAVTQRQPDTEAATAAWVVGPVVAFLSFYSYFLILLGVSVVL
jgi:chromate transport protein ChrA